MDKIYYPGNPVIRSFLIAAPAHQFEAWNGGPALRLSYRINLSVSSFVLLKTFKRDGITGWTRFIILVILLSGRS